MTEHGGRFDVGDEGKEGGKCGGNMTLASNVGIYGDCGTSSWTCSIDSQILESITQEVCL